MTITIELPDSIGERLGDDAQTQAAAVLVLEKFLTEQDQQKEAIAMSEKMEALFAKWQAEEQTSDPAEIQRRENEMAAFQEAMNAHRAAANEESVY